MLKIFKYVILVVCVLNQAACLKVDDKGNDKVVDALTEQNKILQQQQTSIVVTGSIFNLSTNADASEGTVQIKVGSGFSSPVALIKGVFQLPGLPADSDFELLVHSPTGVFMDRTVFGKTRATSSPGTIYQDLGVFNVGAGVEHKLNFLNSVTNTPISNLVIRANINIGANAFTRQNFQVATYDPVLQLYKIVLPEHIDTVLTAKMDPDGDGEREYLIENNSYKDFGGDFGVSSQLLDYLGPIFLLDVKAHEKISLRVALLDSALKPLVAAKPSVDDKLNGAINGVYDASTHQYVLSEVAIGSQFIMLIPSFVEAGIAYSSASLTVTKSQTNGKLSYVWNSSFFGFNNAPVDIEENQPAVLNLVYRPSAIIPMQSQLRVITASSSIDESTQSFRALYSAPVTLKTDTAKLLKTNSLHVVKGNDSADDLILPGTTLLELIDENIAVDAQLSLNDTLLTLTPKARLTPGQPYFYRVGELVDKAFNTSIDLADDRLEFSLPDVNKFKIEDIRLDNNNFYYNDVVINAANSAGDSVLASFNGNFGNAGRVTLYLPGSVSSLKSLTLRKEKVIINNVEGNHVDYITLVSESRFNSGRVLIYSAATNENIVMANQSSFDLRKGTSMPNGFWYAQDVNEFMSDNSSANINSIGYSYAFETKEGTVVTGSITLPVM